MLSLLAVGVKRIETATVAGAARSRHALRVGRELAVAGIARSPALEAKPILDGLGSDSCRSGRRWA